MYNNVMPVILAGGVGSRLSSVVSDRPKPLAEVNGRPFITYLLDQLVDVGFKRVIISIRNVNIHKINIYDIIGDTYKTLNIKYIMDTVVGGGTGNALIDVANSDYVNAADNIIEHLLVMNGDTFIDIDLIEFIKNTFTKDSSFVLSLVNGPTNAGIYLFPLSAISKVAEFGTKLGPFSIDKDLLLLLVPLGGVSPYVTDKPFIDIGTPESYAKANEFMKDIKPIGTLYHTEVTDPENTVIELGVGALIFNEKGEILLEQRSDNGLWGAPGGGVNVGESVFEAVVREVKEETGLMINYINLFGVYSNPSHGHILEYVSSGNIRHSIAIIFIVDCVIDNGWVKSEESLDLRFFDVHKLPEKLVPTFKYVMDDVKQDLQHQKIFATNNAQYVIGGHIR